MLGHAELWFYQNLAGIRVDLSKAGSDQITIKPEIVGDITFAEADYESVVGRISIRWERRGANLN